MHASTPGQRNVSAVSHTLASHGTLGLCISGDKAQHVKVPWFWWDVEGAG